MSRTRRIRRKKPRAGSVWKKLLLWGVLGMLVLAAAAVAGSYLYVRAYLKSDGFLAMLEQSAIDDMNVETARIAPLDWDGSGIRCGGVMMEGHELLTSLQARDIETEFSRWDLLKRAFVMTSVNIAELKLQLRDIDGGHDESALQQIPAAEFRLNVPGLKGSQQLMPLHHYAAAPDAGTVPVKRGYPGCLHIHIINGGLFQHG